MPRGLARKRPRLAEALDMDHCQTNHYFRRTGGAINKILQHNGRVVVCSNTAGGTITGETDPYNKPGTLISWCQRDPLKILDLEQRDGLYGTHYSVHCIAYDPVSNILASSAADKYVRTWIFDGNDDDNDDDNNNNNDDDDDDDDDNNENNNNPYTESNTYQYKVKNKPTSPHELAFKPGESILAIGEQNLMIQNISTGSSHAFRLFDNNQGGHVTGAIAWGSGASSSFIFALSEPVGENDHHGSHIAFDVQASRRAFKFDATGAGDALCVNPTGTTVALVTNDGSESLLRIYDVANTRASAMQTRSLEPFMTESQEVNSMTFSSDSIYLAIGRDDNRTHVYDSRMLERGILFNFEHSEPQFSADQAFFGVAKVEWVESRFSRLGLVTGGNDGCVRLWDPLRANEEGIVLARANSDIAYFSIGDPFEGEHRLVVGDSDGAVYVMDGHPSM
ncbi:WD40-repeat-containing domain protein [Mycena latifolia]|nr:WD40-repeat-containing domain protein [Mycena latifolia]